MAAQAALVAETIAGMKRAMSSAYSGFMFIPRMSYGESSMTNIRQRRTLITLLKGPRTVEIN